MSSKRNSLNMLDKAFGVLLVLVGLVFLSLLTLLKLSGELAGDLKVSTFFLCTGAIFVWIGCMWFFSKPQPHAPRPQDKNDRYLLRLRRPVEFGAAVGLMLMGMRAVALLYGADWVPTSALWALVLAPVLIERLALRILRPGLFSDYIVSRWSAPTRRLVDLLLRIVWVAGFPAMLLALPGIQDLVAWTGRISVQFVASTFISLLYASQVLVLHFGQVRQRQGENCSA
jgi:small-conductance mechanosensitive channel